jgi:hypothetical protein
MRQLAQSAENISPVTSRVVHLGIVPIVSNNDRDRAHQPIGE